MEDLVLKRLTAWSVSADGLPGTVPSRYAREIEVAEQPDVAKLRLAVRKAFVAGMAYANSIAEAANRHTAA